MRFGSVENAIEHAAEVERKTYRESLQNNRDQILLSKRLATIHTDVPIDVRTRVARHARAGCRRLREMYRTLEFSSLLRDLAPAAEAPRQRDYQQLGSEAELDAWLQTLPADAPVAVAVGEVMSSNRCMGFSAKPGVARPLTLARNPGRASIGHDLKALIRHFGDTPRLCDTMSCYMDSCSRPTRRVAIWRISAERYLERPLDADPAAQADTILSLYQTLRPQVESQKLAEVYETIDLPLIRVLARMEETGIRVDPVQLGAHERRVWKRKSRAYPARSLRSPVRPSISTRHNNWVRFCLKI